MLPGALSREERSGISIYSINSNSLNILNHLLSCPDFKNAVQLANSVRSARRKGAVELHFKNRQCCPHCPCIEVSGRFSGGCQGSRIRSALCAYKKYIPNHFRILLMEISGQFLIDSGLYSIEPYNNN